MLNLNSDVINVSYLELLNASEKNHNNKIETKETSANIKNETEEGVNVKLSEQVLSQINEIMSEEDSTSLKLQKAQIIYDSLSNIRLKLQDLVQLLHDPEMNFDVNVLEKMDSMSNSLIESVIDTVKNNDDMNIVNPDLLNIYFSGLNSIKQLNLADNDFLTKIQMIDSNVKAQENEYFKATESLYEKYTEITNKYEKLADEKNFKETDKTIDKQIIENSEQTLASTTANISPETVMRLLMG